MEMALDPSLPTYSRDLGVLAGATLRAAADLGVSMVGMSLVHRKGCFHQTLDPKGIRQKSLPPGTPMGCRSR
jgi:starch phosphorylase